MRKTRKDGSCFYRCFLFRLFELLIQSPSLFEKYKVFEKIKQGREMLLDAGFQDIVFEDFEDVFRNMVVEIQKGNVSQD